MASPTPKLLEQLEKLPGSVRTQLDDAGFDQKLFLELAATLTEGDAATRRQTRNTVKGEVAPPRPHEIVKIPPLSSNEADAFRERGEDALKNGELAFCTMAGGMATRMGGIVKALAEAWDGHSFLDLRLGENRSASERAGRAIPLWLMTSEATHDALAAALKEKGAPAHVALFMQNLSLRLNPDGTLFTDDAGEPSIHATGHGDLVDALRRSKLLEDFVGKGGKYVWITNIDNLGASIDPLLLGMFIAASGSGAVQVQGEMCRKEGDKGGIPVHAEGRLQVVEEFRLPKGFDPATVSVFNTNTFLVRAEPLLRHPFTWTYFEVEKKVDGRPAIQFERLIQEITAHLPSTFVEVGRDGAESRFLPVKDFDELAKRRPTIEVVAKARGMV
jgi:UTP--glucose-1-phosphate uridylyltransferase